MIVLIKVHLIISAFFLSYYFMGFYLDYRHKKGTKKITAG